MLKTFLLSALLLMHPVHVTLTSIDFDLEHGSCNVFVRMYFDDFMNDSRMIGNTLNESDFKSCTPASLDELNKYIEKKLIIRVNERLISGRVKEMQVSENEISMNLEYKGSSRPALIFVKNLIMTSLYADMSNMVIVTVKDYEEGVKLTSDITEQTFTIK
jgi:hypothetical protein